MRSSSPSISLQASLDQYLGFRRALGVKLRLPGRLLQRFVDFADAAGATYITTELALAWAIQPSNAQPVQWANRLGMVRRFAQYCSAIDPRTLVPPQDLLPYHFHRPEPYIYRDEDIRRLLEAAKQLPSENGLRPHTYATLFGLYVATGMRTNEPLKMNRDDVDLANGILTIRESKFDKSRYVPVHPTTQRALRRYAKQRDLRFPQADSPSFFLSDRGTRLTEWSVRWTFVKLSCQIGLRGTNDSHGPRLLDFRHRLAINTLTEWHRRGVDVERHLPELSTYLGHAHITDTYWYLAATPQLMHYVLRRVSRSGQEERR
jgi:integrase/recombinase XerD